MINLLPLQPQEIQPRRRLYRLMPGYDPYVTVPGPLAKPPDRLCQVSRVRDWLDQDTGHSNHDHGYTRLVIFEHWFLGISFLKPYLQTLFRGAGPGLFDRLRLFPLAIPTRISRQAPDNKTAEGGLEV